VRKEVPTVQRVMARLHKRFPEVSDEVLERRARKFTDKIFPLFLTREAGILMILQRDMPAHVAHRVPSLLHMERDARGYVRRLWMTWLRNGGEPLSQLQFAMQAADLLQALHEDARVVHLDLRLDNMVITPGGVGFVDFGSAVRIGEDISANPLLATLFDELMRTSQIQRMLEQMTQSGAVTSSAIAHGYQKVDPAVDFFYLALQISAPHGNPDLADLIRYDPASDEAVALAELTGEILKPRDPQQPPYQSAKDIYWGLKHIDGVLKRARRGG
jgi:serine/threonine protein kinase